MRTTKIAASVVAGVLLSACAEQTAMRVANDTVHLNVSTAPIYGALEPQRRAMLMAAEETVKAGFDKFIIVNAQTGFSSNVTGMSPGMVHAGGGQLYGTGPQVHTMPRFGGGFTVKMFKAGDPAGANAIEARPIIQAASAA